MLLIGAVALIVVFAGIAGFSLWKWQSLKADPKVSAQETSSRIIKKAGEIYELPSGEEPTVALIQDKTKLKNQSFFGKAKNGDYVLMYTKSKLALLYREKDNRIINAGPISIDDSSGSPESIKTPAQP